ncbi:MAG: hypothetical protein ACRDV7_03995 [Acidimicrobiia bacterium]
MMLHQQLFQGAAIVVVAATAVTLGTALGVGSAGDEPSPVPAARPDAMVQVNPWTVGDAAVGRCDLLPDQYVERNESVLSGGGGENGVNAWAAGDVAVARYLNELARLCPAGR